MSAEQPVFMAAEYTLHESEAHYRELFENANEIIYTLDLQGRITAVNCRAELVFGDSREKLLGQNVAAFVPPEYLPRMADALRRKMAGETAPTVYELELVCPDGRRVPIEVSSRLIVRHGQAVGIQGTARDISERKHAEQALRAVQEQLKLVTDSMSAAVTRCSRDLRYIWVSNGYAALLGMTPEEIAGRTIAEVIGPEANESIRPYYERALAGERVEYETLVNYRPLGPRWIHAVYTPTLDNTGVPDGWVAVVADVSSRRAAEEALKDADRRKDEFLAMLAHELRNPLAPIRNAVQVLKLLGPAEPQLQQVQNMIERQVAHMAHLVDDLLDVSRITRGKILLRRERFDLTLLVRAAVDDQRSVLANAGLKLSLDLVDRPLWMDGDPTRLAQVVGNLLNNACKFTDAGGEVAVRLSVEESTAVLSVRDTGIGMEAEILARLFEPFSQADRSLDRSRGGLGLGLALVKGLVGLHGGAVRAVSAGLGKGAEFTIRLPLCTDGSRPDKLGSNLPLIGKALRILVVEDNRDAAESLRMLLSLSGHQVETVHAGAPALTAAARFRPDVVLCDIGLPGGMDGYEVARALRADPELCGAALIALSGYGQEEDQRRARQAGFDRHLTKPVDPALLAGLLDSLSQRIVR